MSWQIKLADAAKLPLGDRSVDLVLGSPPYCDARTYGIGAQRDCQEWIDWMLGVTREACRVSKGLVIWVCAGVTRDWCYWPACEGLLYEWWKQGGQCWRPAYWHRVGIPGSGGKQWLRADVEYGMVFKGEAGKVPWADNTANGHLPKWGPGGEMSSRLADGTRCNQWGRVGSGRGRRKDGTRKDSGSPSHKVFHTKRNANGGMDEQVYVPPAIANPGTRIEVPEDDPSGMIQGIKVGGGHMGHDRASENEAPYPLKLAEWFIRGWCPPGGTVCDPFSGSGTTAHAALNLGRNAQCFDIRLSQVFLGRKRLMEVEHGLSAHQTTAAAS